jgi:protoheme ferro-lyase
VVLLHDGGPEDLAPATILASALEDRLVAHLAFPLRVVAASPVAGPGLDEVFSAAAPVSLGVPLDPVWTSAGARSWRAAVDAAGYPQVEFVAGWQKDEGLIRAVASRARAALGDERLDAAAVLFVARGLPPSGGEYYDLAQRLAARLVGLMAPGDWRLAFLGSPPAAGTTHPREAPVADAPPGQPLPAEVADLLAWEWPTLLVVPIGHVLERAETQSLDARLRPAVEAAGRIYRRAAAAAADPGLLIALADAVVDHLARRPLPVGGR